MYRPVIIYIHIYEDSSVGKATAFRLGVLGLIPGRSKRSVSTPQRPDRSLFLKVKWPRPKADHSPPSSAEVKNGGVIPPLLHTSLWRSA
jgi:hypothetical protein